MDIHIEADQADDNSGLSIKRRLLRVLLVFVTLQAIVAAIVMRRVKRIEKARESKRPDRYQFRSFQEVELEHERDKVKLYMEGTSLLDDLIADFDAATSYIMFETFIWVDDETGQALRDALRRAAARGVACYVSYDWVLSDKAVTPEWFGEEINAFAFRPIDFSPRALRPQNVIRNHRKVIVVDRKIAWIGGYNVGDEYIAWRDTHVRMVGESVGDVENAFVDFWNHHRPITMEPLPNNGGRSWDPHVQVHRNDPSTAIFPIRGMYLEAMDRAEKRLWFTNAYFIPDRAFRAAIVTAARRGVDVRILIPAQSNHPLTDVLSHGMFEELLTAGVRIFQYRHFMVHAKTCVIDDEWSTVGTANLDRWSMIGNFEINLEIRSRRFAQQMIEMFEFDMKSCRELDLSGWRGRPMGRQVSERILSSLSPLM